MWQSYWICRVLGGVVALLEEEAVASNRIALMNKSMLSSFVEGVNCVFGPFWIGSILTWNSCVDKIALYILHNLPRTFYPVTLSPTKQIEDK